MTCPALSHDTFNAYQNEGCRCPEAVAANFRYSKALRLDHSQGRRRLIDGLGVRRRLRALAAIGYSQPELAVLLGTSQQAVWHHLSGTRSPLVKRATHDRVAAVYTSVALHPSVGPRADAVARWALHKGWAPPAAWDDNDLDRVDADPHWEWLMCTVDGCEQQVKAAGYCNAHYTRWRRHGDPLGGGPTRSRDVERKLWLKVDKVSSQTGCWLWTGSVNKSGYAVIGVQGRQVRVHRFVYEVTVGPIPDGLSLDHVCHTHDRSCTAAAACLHRRCVNPAHLEPVTRAENNRRGGNARKTRCSRGHKLDSIVRRSDGTTERRCSQCHARRARRARGDVDPVIVDRLVAGEPVTDTPTPAEKVAAYRRMTAAAFPFVEIQERLRVNGQTMQELATAADAASIEAAA